MSDERLPAVGEVWASDNKRSPALAHIEAVDDETVTYVPMTDIHGHSVAGEPARTIPLRAEVRKAGSRMVLRPGFLERFKVPVHEVPADDGRGDGT